jgi:hypothetical protein
MHQVVPLGFSFARVGKLYLGMDGRRVLYVYPDLYSSRHGPELAALKAALVQRSGRGGQFDKVVIIPKDNLAPAPSLLM